jgi:hypothetical protein
VLVDLRDLGLRGWQSLGGFVVISVFLDDPYHVLLITPRPQPAARALPSVLPGIVHHAISSSSSASGKIEKSACDQSNPARYPIRHTHPVELVTITA